MPVQISAHSVNVATTCSEAIHPERQLQFIEVDAHTPCLRCMTPPIMAPATATPSGGRSSRRFPAYAIEYGAFTAIQRCFQLKTSQSLSRMKYSVIASLPTPSDAPESQRILRHPRSITQVEEQARDKERNGREKMECRCLSR